MRPNTPHHVVSFDNCISIGQHLFPRATIRQTCFAILHLGVAGEGLTNTVHPAAAKVLRRMAYLSMYDHLNAHQFQNSETAY
jgi:hypothetical protein